MSEELQADAPEPSDDFQLELDGLEVSDTDELTTDVNRIVDEIRENQGVNRDIALSIEAMQPGSISGRVPINSFTRDYTRTNYQVANEVIAEMGAVAIGGIILASAVILVALGAWIRKKFFSQPGGGAARDKVLEHALEHNKEFKSNVKKALAALKSHTKNLSPEEIKEIEDMVKDQEMTKLWAGKYTELVEEMLGGKGNHLQLVKEITTKLPGYMTQLEDLAGKLHAAVAAGKGDGINPADYSVNVEIAGITKDQIDGKLPALKEEYSKKNTYDPNRPVKANLDPHAAIGYGVEFDRLKEEDVKKLETYAESAKKEGEEIKNNKEIGEKWSTNAVNARKLLNERSKRIADMWSILGIIQTAHTRITEVLNDKTIETGKKIEGWLEKASKDLEGQDLELVTGLLSTFKTWLTGTSKWKAAAPKEGEGAKPGEEPKK